MGSSITKKSVKGMKKIKIQWVTPYGRYFDTKSEAAADTRLSLAEIIIGKIRRMRRDTCQMPRDFNNGCMCEQCLEFDLIIDNVEDLGNI